MESLKNLIASGDFGAAWAALLEQFRETRDYPTITKLCRSAARLEKTGGLPDGLMPWRIALLSGATTDLLMEPQRLALIATGIRPEIHVGAFNQFVPEMLDPAGAVSAFAPQVAIVVNTAFNIAEWPAITDSTDAVDPLVDQACRFLLEPCRQLHERVRCDVVLNTLLAPASRPAGNLGAKLPGDSANFIRRVNMALGDRAPTFVHLNDVAALAARRGTDQFFDARFWYHAKQPFSFAAIGDYVHNTAAIVGAIVGKTRKCVAVDLDGTLWGGVVGDDGVEGLELGEGTAEGEAFKAFQIYLRDLKSRGVLLAVCSKNDEAIAKSAFTKHPEMVLSLDDFVAFAANWGPKSDSLEAMARQLGLGLDSFVFVDDNPAEREQVRQVLPTVAVPEMPDDPSDYIRALESGRYFESISLTHEDTERTQSYQRRQDAADVMHEATDLSAFLASLDMKAVIRPFDEVSFDRITQLTNKTNQFNLTTQRVTRSEIEAMSRDPQYLTRSVRLSDRFGDHGLISVFFARIADQVMTIEAWLMSCRVLNRNVEKTLLQNVLDAASELGVTEIIGLFKPTERNGIVKDLFGSLGFSLVDENASETQWRLTVSEAPCLDADIHVTSEA